VKRGLLLLKKKEQRRLASGEKAEKSSASCTEELRGKSPQPDVPMRERTQRARKKFHRSLYKQTKGGPTSRGGNRLQPAWSGDSHLETREGVGENSLPAFSLEHESSQTQGRRNSPKKKKTKKSFVR